MTIGRDTTPCANGSCSYPCPYTVPNGYCPFTACINHNKKSVRNKTYEEILTEFKQKYSIEDIDDYRPFDYEFIKGKSGIVVWLKNGDMVIYYPKSITKIYPDP